MGNITSFRREFGLIVIGAIIFIASFLWKDLFVEIEEKYFPKEAGLFGRFIYVIVITIILVTVAIELKRRFGLVQAGDPIGFDSDASKNQRDSNTSDTTSVDSTSFDTGSSDGGTE